MKLLNIVSSGYRATIEEQDDTIVWLTHCLRNAGAEADILLCGSAVNYPVREQSVDPVRIGERIQTHGPDVHGQVRDLAETGAKVFAVREDLEVRSIDSAGFLRIVEIIPRKALPQLFKSYERVWNW